jgi:hypothetical protein
MYGFIWNTEECSQTQKEYIIVLKFISESSDKTLTTNGVYESIHLQIFQYRI